MEQHRFWIHSCRVPLIDGEVVVVNEKVATINDDNTVTWDSNLTYIKDPKRPFYIHKPQYQTYKYKIEYVKKEECDKYICFNKDVANEVKKKLNIFSNQFMPMTKICESPYVYGADADIEMLIKLRYLNNIKNVSLLAKPVFASLDLEVSVLGDEQINLASICHKRVVYCGILDDFLYKPTGAIDKNGNPVVVKATMDDVYNTVEKELRHDYLDRFNLKVEYYLAKSEMELISWIFKTIHKLKPDFLGIWNMPYDVPKLMERISFYKRDPKDFFCHPDVPKDYRYLKYKKDFAKVDHYTESWDWTNVSGYTQPIDSMRLYSRIRKVQGKEPFYNLDFISEKEIKHGKHDIGADHHYNQKYNFLSYIAYNIVDAGNVWLMEEKNHDVENMCGLVGESTLKDFSKQTLMLKNSFYAYCDRQGLVAGTVGTSMGTPFDDLIGKAGGTVLPPYLIKDMGLQCIEERPTLHTLINIFIKDIDAAAIYPSTMIGFNLSKETCKATMVSIDDHLVEDIETLFTGMIAPRENALLIGKKFFNLPDPQDLLQEYNQWFMDRQGQSRYEIERDLLSDIQQEDIQQVA